jgi:dolichol-phosphate mannosyltransferase
VLSIVLPAYNEAPALADLLRELERDVASRVGDAELVVVDDASTDETPGLLRGLEGEIARLRVERRSANAGHGPTVARALDLAAGAWIFQLDSDRQFVVSDFWRLWAARGSADLVLGVRVDRRDPRSRLVLSRVVAAAVSLLAGRRLQDPNVPFRLVRSELWDDLRPLLPAPPLAPSILTALGAAARGWRIAEVPVSHRPRTHGASSLRSWRLVRFSLRGLVELLRFRVRLMRWPRGRAG